MEFFFVAQHQGTSSLSGKHAGSPDGRRRLSTERRLARRRWSAADAVHVDVAICATVRIVGVFFYLQGRYFFFTRVYWRCNRRAVKNRVFLKRISTW